MSLIVFGIVLPWLAVGLGGWLGYQLLRQNGRLLLHLEALEKRLAQPATAPTAAPSPAAAPPSGLPLGSVAPPFELPDLAGERRALAAFRGRRLLLIFFNPLCGFCTRMAPDLAALPTDGAEGRPLPLLVTSGDVEATRRLVEEHGIRCPVLLQAPETREALGEVAAQYQVRGTPIGYLIDEHGKIASELAIGAEALLKLAQPRAADGGSSSGPKEHRGNRDLGASKIDRNGLPAGTPAPAFRLPALEGGELSLQQYRGQRVLLVFSDPTCGPCQQLAPELEQFHRRTGEVQVLMVSRGDVEANRAKAEEYGLTFPIGLQKQWEVSREYAMFATPIAYLLNTEGVTAAEVAIGVEPIRALLARIEAEGVAPARERRCPCGKARGECGCGAKNGRAKAAAGRRR
jgi:peroxiredoxin